MNKDGLFGVYVNTKTFTLNQLNPNVVLLNHRCYFKINDEHDYYHGHGFTNMKIEGDYKLLEKISFFMGNEYIEAIYPKKSGKTKFSIFANNIVPYVFPATFNFFIELDKNLKIEDIDKFKIMIDVMKITNPIEGDETVDISYTDSYQDEHYIDEGTCKVRMNLNLDLTKLLFISNAKILNLNLNCDGLNIPIYSHDQEDYKKNDNIITHTFDDPVKSLKVNVMMLEIESCSYSDSEFDPIITIIGECNSSLLVGKYYVKTKPT